MQTNILGWVARKLQFNLRIWHWGKTCDARKRSSVLVLILVLITKQSTFDFSNCKKENTSKGSSPWLTSVGVGLFLSVKLLRTTMNEIFNFQKLPHWQNFGIFQQAEAFIPLYCLVFLCNFHTTKFLLLLLPHSP